MAPFAGISTLFLVPPVLSARISSSMERALMKACRVDEAGTSSPSSRCGALRSRHDLRETRRSVLVPASPVSALLGARSVRFAGTKAVDRTPRGR